MAKITVTDRDIEVLDQLLEPESNSNAFLTALEERVRQSSVREYIQEFTAENPGLTAEFDLEATIAFFRWMINLVMTSNRDSEEIIEEVVVAICNNQLSTCADEEYTDFLTYIVTARTGLLELIWIESLMAKGT